MSVRYGLDVFTPTNQPNDDPWKPIMASKTARKVWPSAVDAVSTMMAMEAGNGALKLRVVEVQSDDPTRGI